MPALAFCQPYLTTSLPISVTPQEAAVFQRPGFTASQRGWQLTLLSVASLPC